MLRAPAWHGIQSLALQQQLFHWVPLLHACELHVEALEGVDKALVVDA